MRKLLLVICLAFSLGMNAQRIKFEYDSAGNQTKRYVCICSAKMANDSIYKTKETIVENDMIQDAENEQLSYYPNPVLEQLYIKWKNSDFNPVKEIKLYSMSGQILKKQNEIAPNELLAIDFQNYPTGFYNLIVIYSNGKNKTLKIVKQ